MSEEHDCDPARQSARELLRFIDASPSPWHAGGHAAETLRRHGFRALDEAAAWQLEPGGAYYVARDVSSLIAFRLGSEELSECGLRAVGAHTDSPGFRVKPQGAHPRGDLLALGVEVYGGPILATFADRDLTLAGRVMVSDGDGELQARLVHFPEPLLRLPNVAIHLNRGVNEDGLKFDRQEEVPLLLGALQESLPSQTQFRRLLGERLGCEPERILSWGLAVADTQPGALYGPGQEFIAASQLDNLASCHAGLQALLAAAVPRGVQMLALFDHEEVGSASYKGAAGNFLESVVRRIFASLGVGDADVARVLARSWLLSADMAHAFHPSFARYYEPQHQIAVNGGPAIKINANQRYATDEVGEAFFAALCQSQEVPCQRYVQRSNVPCGSTIGPMSATRLGVRTIDVGNPMWSMHSLRESAGALDHARMIRVMRAFYEQA